jgi:hypothetical protein
MMPPTDFATDFATGSGGAVAPIVKRMATTKTRDALRMVAASCADGGAARDGGVLLLELSAAVVDVADDAGSDADVDAADIDAADAAAGLHIYKCIHTHSHTHPPLHPLPPGDHFALTILIVGL